MKLWINQGSIQIFMMSRDGRLIGMRTGRTRIIAGTTAIFLALCDLLLNEQQQTESIRTWGME